MVPKLALDVMSCEVIRVLQLTDSCIVPISYQVPRKVSGVPTCAEDPERVREKYIARVLNYVPESRPGVS